MLQNYIVIALRSLRKNRLYSSLNIGGLAIGVAACMLILLFVTHEWSYDRWNPLSDRIVRPTYQIRINGFEENHGSVDAVVGPEAAATLPEIEAWCRLRKAGSWNTRTEGQAESGSREEQVLAVDSSFFTVFPLQVLAGDARHCLNEPGMLAISRSLAAYYFGTPAQALGQTLLIGRNSQRQQVSAVFEDMPTNTHFQANMLLPLTGNEELKNAPPYWGYNNQYFTYLLLRKGVDKEVFAGKFAALAGAKVGVLLQELFATTTADFEKAGKIARFDLQNLTDINLHSAKQSELAANSNIRYVWILGAIAFFILLIACINFMNLATARAAERAREVGVRKVLGSSRQALAAQFLAESLSLSGMAMVLALGLAALALPAFSELAGRPLTMPWRNPTFWAVVLGGTGVVGLLAGSYPALFLSAFKTIQVLKGGTGGATGSKRGYFRNGLVVFQFTISSILIISTVLVYSQLRYMQQKNLGFDKSQVLIIENANALGEQAAILETQLRENAQVESVTRTNYLPLPDKDRGNCIISPTRTTKGTSNVVQRWLVDANYLPTLGMQLQSGRNFDPGRVTDSSVIIVNETAAKALGFADPIGQKMYRSRSNDVNSKPEDFEELTIVGVVRDFHYESLHAPIGGLFLQFGRPNGAISLRLSGANAAQVIADLEKKWQALTPDQAVSYHFMDESLNRRYAAERRVGLIASIFAGLSILVSCLGLFGLAVYTTQQRTKEIGVRKVLGASVTSIASLLTLDFLKLVLVAIVIASPLAAWIMRQWLQDFAYRIEIHWWVFLLAGLFATLIAFITVSFQSVKAALANPVKSLRNE